jgi:hypothetical protein
MLMSCRSSSRPTQRPRPAWAKTLSDVIQSRWGSYPLWEVVHAYKHAEANFGFIDFDRAIMAGASFGRYMTNS